MSVDWWLVTLVNLAIALTIIIVVIVVVVAGCFAFAAVCRATNWSGEKWRQPKKEASGPTAPWQQELRKNELLARELGVHGNIRKNDVEERRTEFKCSTCGRRVEVYAFGWQLKQDVEDLKCLACLARQEGWVKCR